MLRNSTFMIPELLCVARDSLFDMLKTRVDTLEVIGYCQSFLHARSSDVSRVRGRIGTEIVIADIRHIYVLIIDGNDVRVYWLQWTRGSVTSIFGLSIERA